LVAQAQEQPGDGAAAGQQQMVTLRQMAEATLGRPGGVAASAIYLLLAFSLLTAYIAKVPPCQDYEKGTQRRIPRQAQAAVSHSAPSSC